MNTTEEAVGSLESTDVDRWETGDLSAYIEGLGGRLEVIADFGTERFRLR